MIPKIIHFVWIGAPMPQWAERNINEFRRLNPDHEIRLHNESILLEKYRPLYDTCEFECQKTDLLRYSALEQSGGWYFDVDYWPFRPVTDIKNAHLLNGARIFVTDSGRPSKLTNAVIGAPANWDGWNTVSDIIFRNAKSKSRNKYGPDMVNRIHKDKVTVGGAVWFNGVDVPIAPTVYKKCIAGQNDDVKLHLKLQDNQYPFAMHLWAGTNASKLDETNNTNRDVCFMLKHSTHTRWEIPLLDGFKKAGYMVLQADDVVDIGELPAVSVLWNGLRKHEKTDKVKNYSRKIMYLEHGFFNRSRYIQADMQGFLHWASWVKHVNEPAPECGKKRLAEFYPHGIKPLRYNNTGYILVLGQVGDDTQMWESEIKGPIPLQRVLSRAIPNGIKIYFRPHPLASNTRRNPHHKLLPEFPHENERPSYKKNKHGNGLLEALRGAMFVITINSNAIVESLAEGVPCLAFGPHIGIEAGAVHKTTCATLESDIREMLKGWKPPQVKVQNYLEWLAARQWNETELNNPELLKAIVAGDPHACNALYREKQVVAG